MPEDRGAGRDHEAQPTVLVSGQARELLRQVPLQLTAERFRAGDGAVVVTAREDPGVVARRLCGAVPAADPDRVAMVDATSKARATPTRVDDRRWHVPSPVAFEQVAAAVEAALAELHARESDRVHLLFDALTTQFRLADAGAVHRFTHGMATRAARTGPGLFTVEPSVTVEREFEQLRHFVDAHVSVRRTPGGPQVRWTGAHGDSEGWVSLADAGLRFDALGRCLG